MTKTIFTLLLSAVLSTAVSAQTFTGHIDIQCGDTAYVGNLGSIGSAIPEITQLPQYGHAMLLGDFAPANLLQYQAPFYYSGTDTVVIKCAKATQITCDTGIYVFHVGCNTVYDPIYTVQVACNDTVKISDLSGFGVPQIAQAAHHGQATIFTSGADLATLLYIPNPGFEGLDNVLVSLFQGQDTVNYLFQVYCDGTTGTSDKPGVQSVNFFPQPAFASVFADGITGEVNSVKTIDISGRTINVKYENTGNRLMLDVSTLLPGIYIVEIRTAPGQIWVGKMVKQP